LREQAAWLLLSKPQRTHAILMVWGLPLLASGLGLREYAVVCRAVLSDQTGLLELGLWDKSNDFADLRSTPLGEDLIGLVIEQKVAIAGRIAQHLHAILLVFAWFIGPRLLWLARKTEASDNLLPD